VHILLLEHTFTGLFEDDLDPLGVRQQQRRQHAPRLD
jgi:hypothetical protein